jgi:hypothetical protein
MQYTFVFCVCSNNIIMKPWNAIPENINDFQVIMPLQNAYFNDFVDIFSKQFIEFSSSDEN